MKTIEDAKALLQKEGLFVSSATNGRLCIAPDVSFLPDSEIPISRHPWNLEPSDGGWIAICCANPPERYELRGSLSELVSLLVNAFGVYRTQNVPLDEVIPKVVVDAERYLVR